MQAVKQATQYETMPIPETAGRGRKRLHDWKALIVELKALPDGQALKIQMSEKSKGNTSTLWAAFHRNGCSVRVHALGGGLFAVWESR